MLLRGDARTACAAPNVVLTLNPKLPEGYFGAQG